MHKSKKENRLQNDKSNLFSDWILYYHNELRSDPEFFNEDLKEMKKKFDTNDKTIYNHTNDIQIQTERGKIAVEETIQKLTAKKKYLTNKKLSELKYSKHMENASE